MAQQIAVSLARTNFDIHGKLVALSKQMDVGAPGARLHTAKTIRSIGLLVGGKLGGRKWQKSGSATTLYKNIWTGDMWKSKYRGRRTLEAQSSAGTSLLPVEPGLSLLYIITAGTAAIIITSISISCFNAKSLSQSFESNSMRQRFPRNPLAGWQTSPKTPAICLKISRGQWRTRPAI